MNKSEQSIVKRLKDLLNAKRFEHSIRVRELSIELAEHHKVNKSKAGIAGLLHDCSRYLSPEETLKRSEEAGLHIEPIMRFEPKLLHAPLSGYLAKMDFGIDDPEIITAIERHTLGSPKMGVLDKIIYIADHVEPDRSYPGVEVARSEMTKNLDKAVSIIASCMIKYMIDSELPIHPLTLETRNYHLKKAKELW
jgi:predicted HD superfamily hydrolase involved in NAD metabolism